MKNYPRLHSLSTIGIIHHQENDYLFHPERTDFVGDSASGKSIIADLLQLIFVGSTAFKSATATLKEVRDPDGLVLTTQGRGGNIAYAFLNIETAMEQYIVIGAYLESTDKHTRPFIIQTSSTIENDKLVPMDRPLRATDFKNGDYICDLDELTEVMENKLLVLKTWSKIGSYHRILYSNNILPLNLAANDKILKDYAKIIQSFSRAKTLEIKDSKSILNFLFSQDKGKELYNEYVQIAKELESTISEYGQNRGSIQLLMRKYQKVCSLKRSLDAKNRSEKEHLTYELIYSRTEHKRLANSISVDVKKTLAAYHNLQMLLDAAQKDIEQSHKTKSDIDEKVTTTHQSLFKAQTEKDRLAEAQKLLENLQIEEQSLESFYQEYWENKEQYSALQELKTKLSAKNLQSFFEQSEWQKGVAAGNEYYGMRINEIKSDLERLMLLSKYVDIHNPNSLVRWAMSLNRPLSKIEESLLLHFQILKRTEPEHPTNNERFLPSPDALFSNPKIEDRGDSFWIDLGGVWEYVDYVSEQRFNTQNKEELNKYFEHQTQSIEFQRQQLEKERGKLVNMSTIIGELTNAGRAIEIYQKKETVEKFKEIESLNIDADKIQNYLLCLKRKEAIEHNYDQSQQIYKEALAEQNENKSILEKLPTKVKKTEELLQKIKTEEILLAELTKRFSINQAYDYDLSFYHDAEDKVDTFQTEFDFQ
ncbi:MAG: hypothetical protein LBG15_07480, partial [Dysgonamonadaceae bacterium]|nr:hypothetical protein [Dysgonamonadaceae bacterium]